MSSCSHLAVACCIASEHDSPQLWLEFSLLLTLLSLAHQHGAHCLAAAAAVPSNLNPVWATGEMDPMVGDLTSPPGHRAWLMSGDTNPCRHRPARWRATLGLAHPAAYPDSPPFICASLAHACTAHTSACARLLDRIFVRFLMRALWLC